MTRLRHVSPVILNGPFTMGQINQWHLVNTEFAGDVKEKVKSQT